TVVRALGLAAEAQGPGQGELFFRRLLAGLAEIPYLPGPDLGASAASWARQVAAGATVYIVSNSPEVFASALAALGRSAHPLLVLTGSLPRRRRSTAGPQPDVVIEDFDTLSDALVRLARSGFRETEVVVGGA
ncbi:MAG: hypothetical protein J7M26_10665, partial [Armatimonadetes bacterium]|nr:hypothetical protein [Armatimonadota bacterium]